ncbi:uncharacterized protein LOC118439281 [Folsomia candida]|uniref:Uncharacterized protein n=1 Tax=Folsomia candida TaxID=158441 RepID=A0A226D8C7_FOLCA|nr:uncharacterized protein LOC118439281 [Folsomia candida]OXA40506.1 hypothetical protein Fcan01_24794 [Folsomia candida]
MQTDESSSVSIDINQADDSGLLSEDMESSDEDVVILRRGGRKLRVICSDSEDDDDENVVFLDRSNPDPQPGSSRDMTVDLDLLENFHLRRYGKLSRNLRELECREELIDWLKEVEKNPSAGRATFDQRREELELAANWRQEDREHREIYFDIRITGSSVKGYWVLRAEGKRNVLSSYYAANMRLGASQARIDRNANYRNPEHPLHDSIQNSRKTTNEVRPPMDIVYVASLIHPDNMGVDLWETIKSIEPVQQGNKMRDYVGKYNGNKGRFSMRGSNFTKPGGNQEIYNRTVDSDDSVYCVEKKIILCNSTYTKEIGEGFLMAYGHKYNEIHGVERYIMTEAATPPADLIKKAHKYAVDGVPMFEFVEDLDRSNPPLWATLDLVTTLPYTICKKDLIIRYDPNFPDDKRHYKSFKNFDRLVEEFGYPPEEYFITIDGSRNHLRY